MSGSAGGGGGGDGGDEDELRDFGDVPLSVMSIPKPPDMEITINRRCAYLGLGLRVAHFARCLTLCGNCVRCG